MGIRSQRRCPIRSARDFPSRCSAFLFRYRIWKSMSFPSESRTASSRQKASRARLSSKHELRVRLPASSLRSALNLRSCHRDQIARLALAPARTAAAISATITPWGIRERPPTAAQTGTADRHVFHVCDRAGESSTQAPQETTPRDRHIRWTGLHSA